MRSVLQDWVMDLPLREQGTLLTAVRGCDDEPKTWRPARDYDGNYVPPEIEFSPARRLTAYIRWCFMNPADPREVDYSEGAFFRSVPPMPFKPSALGRLPLHWYSHAMHALEVIGYRHPFLGVAETARSLYGEMAHGLHLNVETREEMIARLSCDRIAEGTVVS